MNKEQTPEEIYGKTYDIWARYAEPRAGTTHAEKTDIQGRAICQHFGCGIKAITHLKNLNNDRRAGSPEGSRKLLLEFIEAHTEKTV